MCLAAAGQCFVAVPRPVVVGHCALWLNTTWPASMPHTRFQSMWLINLRVRLWSSILISIKHALMLLNEDVLHCVRYGVFGGPTAYPSPPAALAKHFTNIWTVLRWGHEVEPSDRFYRAIKSFLPLGALYCALAWLCFYFADHHATWRWPLASRTERICALALARRWPKAQLARKEEFHTNNTCTVSSMVFSDVSSRLEQC